MNIKKLWQGYCLRPPKYCRRTGIRMKAGGPDICSSQHNAETHRRNMVEVDDVDWSLQKVYLVSAEELDRSIEEGRRSADEQGVQAAKENPGGL